MPGKRRAVQLGLFSDMDVEMEVAPDGVPEKKKRRSPSRRGRETYHREVEAFSHDRMKGKP